MKFLAVAITIVNATMPRVIIHLSVRIGHFALRLLFQLRRSI